MKSFLRFMAFTAFALVALCATAQDPPACKNEIKLCYGILPASEFAASLMDALIFPSAKKDKFDTLVASRCFAYGSVSLQYCYHFSKLISFGGVVAFNPFKINYRYKMGGIEDDTWYCFSMMPRLDFNYVNRKIFTVYSSVAVGVSYFFGHADYNNQPDESFDTFWYAYQFTLAGMRIGKDIGGFVELGYGYQGFINFGLSAKL